MLPIFELQGIFANIMGRLDQSENATRVLLEYSHLIIIHILAQAPTQFFAENTRGVPQSQQDRNKAKQILKNTPTPQERSLPLGRKRIASQLDA